MDSPYKQQGNSVTNRILNAGTKLTAACEAAWNPGTASYVLGSVKATQPEQGKRKLKLFCTASAFALLPGLHHG